ncbi:nuclear envelope pore membrane protein POM 121C-like [Lutra lutra]|uniref:nuclear envelope pore membrane protein POM 121C-like n=1 Tax=Lutra lutra TaxID=9657 RepID=UPI001FD22434|nr:nuclear envelope pore membrane protein POM 121C-like [Lutra lutra]
MVTLCVLQKRGITRLPPSAPRNVHDVSTGERVCRDPRESSKGMAQLKGDPALPEGQETHRKDPKGTGASQGAFRPLGVQGGLSPFVPRPGPLQRPVPQEESSEDPCDKKSTCSHRSSCPTRNAITSSYSSTRGFHPVQRRRGLTTSQASRPPEVPKNVSQESPLCPSGVPSLCQRKNQLEKDADTTTGQKGCLCCLGSGNPGSTAQAPFGAVGGQWSRASTLHSSPQHGEPAAQAPDPPQALSTALAQRSLGSSTQETYMVPLPISASQGTGASAQPVSATSPAVLAPGAASAPGLTAAPQVPSALSHAGPNSHQPCPPGGSTMPAPISMGLLAAPSGLGRGDDVADLCSIFGALSITAGMSRAPSSP